jgi:hypothetical protein
VVGLPVEEIGAVAGHPHVLQRLTYEDYAALPDDGRRYELHEGELSVTPSPGTDHQDILGNLFVVIRGHVRARGLGRVFVAPVDCILGDITVVQPDIVFVETARLSVIGKRAIEGPPTLVVEIISSSSRDRDDFAPAAAGPGPRLARDLARAVKVGSADLRPGPRGGRRHGAALVLGRVDRLER